MLKKEARTLYKQKRTLLSLSQRVKYDDLILIQFQKLNLPFLDYVLSYYPIEEKAEVNTFAITDYLQFKNPGVQIAYPKTNVADHTMQAVVCEDESSFEKLNFNIPEPISCEYIEPEIIDVVLVPLLVCDATGHRVGYGKGFYDRFLKQCSSDCIKIGLSYFEPIESLKDANEFDVPLNICITPQKAYVF